MQPKAPKTPESEKIKSRVSAALFEQGSAMKAKVGEKYLEDVGRRTMGRSASIENLDRERTKRRISKSFANANDGMRHAEASVVAASEGIAGNTQGGVQQRSQALSGGADLAVSAAKNVVNSLDAASSIDNRKAMGKFEQSNAKTQMALDGASAVAGAYLDERWDKEDAARREQRKELEEEERQRNADSISGRNRGPSARYSRGIGG